MLFNEILVMFAQKNNKTMLEILEQDGKKFVQLTELYLKLELKPVNYSKFVRNIITENQYAMEGRDYSYLGTKTSKAGGRPKADYLLSLDFAKEVIMLSKSKVGKKYREWLLELDKKVENLELLTEDQAAFCYKLIEVLKYVSNQKKVREAHQETWINKLPDKENKYVFALFNNYRNGLMGMSNAEIETACKKYCVEHSYSMPKGKTRTTLLAFFDKYELVREAVIDVLSAKGNDSAGAQRLAQTIKNICKKNKVELYTENETTLYQEKEITANVQQLLKK